MTGPEVDWWALFHRLAGPEVAPADFAKIGRLTITQLMVIGHEKPPGGGGFKTYEDAMAFLERRRREDSAWDR